MYSYSLIMSKLISLTEECAHILCINMVRTPVDCLDKRFLLLSNSVCILAVDRRGRSDDSRRDYHGNVGRF